MENNVITIIKKEFARFFGDRRMVFTSLLMPGLIIYIMYSIMGNSFSNMADTSQSTYEIDVVHLPDSMSMLADMDQTEVKTVEAGDVEEAKEKLKSEDLDLLIVFPDDFDEKMLAYDAMTAAEPAPDIEVYYNSASTESGAAADLFSTVADQVESSLANKFDINAGDKEYDVASNEDQMAKMFAMMMPMLVLIFLFSGCLAVSAESIAGEKERGTIATLLVTPMKRRELALGKIASLSVIGVLSGLSSFIGTMLSLPKLMGEMEENGFGNVYQPADYVLLFLVIATAALLMVGSIAIISAFCKTVKEASTAVMPLMIVVMVLSVTSMMGSSIRKAFYWYLIPLYNNVQCLTGIFSKDYNLTNIILTVIANVIYSGILVGVLTKIFDSEKIMYTK